MTGKRETGMEGRDGRPPSEGVEPFADALARRGLSLVRDGVRTLQVNTGCVCNLHCRHCHLEAGPERSERMARGTMEALVSFARRFPFETIDVTGGSPELVPGLPGLVERLSGLTPRLLLRTNLTALESPGGRALLDLCIGRKVTLVASLPSAVPSRVDLQRGPGVAAAAIAMLRGLNAAGYGVEGSGLALDLVCNPVDASLPLSQERTESLFRRDLLREWGIVFTNLYSFANVPLGRFRRWLLDSGNYGPYMKALSESFNPGSITGLMCRTLLSVSWDGFLHDCDFNLAAGRFLGDRKMHVAEVRELPPPGTPIAVGDYCDACTAGSGFT